MAFEQKDMNGALFKNSRKTEDKHPDYTGQCLVDGVPYWMDAWIKEPAGKQKFLSVRFKAKEASAAPAARPAVAEPIDEDDIPF